MIKNLVVFGCGWTWGSELDSQADSYPAKIASANNWTLENNAEPNTSLQSMTGALQSWINRSSKEHIANSLILVGLTDEERGCNKGLTGEELYSNAVTEFNQLAIDNDLRLLQFNVLTKNYRIKVPTLIDSSSALEMLVIRDKPRKDPLFTEHKFPNEKGHTIISEFLLDKIDSVIIHE